MEDDDNNAVQSNCFHSKVMEIESLLSEDEVDLWALREHCLTPGGLMNGKSCDATDPHLILPRHFNQNDQTDFIVIFRFHSKAGLA